MEPGATTIVVVTDANVLINFAHIDRLALLGELEGLQLKLPAEVLEEIADPGQRAAVDAVIASGALELLVVDEIDALALFADFRDLMGRGEAACLALAATKGYYLASDEKRRFRRKAIELIGEARILQTEDLILQAIRCGRISIAEADGYKALLEANRYTMPFKSFAERA